MDECGNCIYAREASYKALQCHYAEPFAQGHLRQWPDVKESDWCGRYEAVGSEIENTYISGNLALTTTDRQVLMSTEGDPDFPVAIMSACQVTNASTSKAVVVFFYDGDDSTKLITQISCPITDSSQMIFPHPVGAVSGEIWCALNVALTTVYVSAQGRKAKGRVP